MTIKFLQRSAAQGGWWVVAQFALFGLILFAFSQNRDPALAFQVIGWVAVVAALILGGSGIWVIRRKITAMHAPAAGAELFEHGPYAIVRHPIYSGVILGFVGLSIKGGNVVALLLSLLLIPFFYAKSLHEERFLIARFPEYESYRERVRYRVLPWTL